MFDELPSPYLGLSIDIGHLNLLEATKATVILDAFPTRIANAGLSDNHGATDDHGALGEGTLDVIGALRALAQSGHRVPVVLEMASDYRQRSLDYLRQRL